MARFVSRPGLRGKSAMRIPGSLGLSVVPVTELALASLERVPILARMETTALPLELSVEEYLKSEAAGQIRHEFIGGRIHAMAGTSERHNLIAMNVGNAFFNHLRGGPCRTYMADFKVRMEIHREDILYYPDVMVACVRDGVEKYFLRYPKLIVEILSESTEAIDRREKLLNYPTIPTLSEYVLIAQDSREITLHRRDEQWRPILLTAPDAPVEFRSIKLTVPLAQIYEGVL
jgi:Uma2 family endonuclease